MSGARFFGEPWDAPITDGAVRVPTPIGQTCLACGEPVAEGDQGLVMPFVYLDDDGAPARTDTAQHRECLLLDVAGHMAGQCFCHEGLGTARERGRATVAWAERSGRPADAPVGRPL